MRPQSPKEKLSRIYGAQVFVNDYSTTVLAAKCMLTPMSILCILDFYAFFLFGLPWFHQLKRTRDYTIRADLKPSLKN